MTPTAFYTSLTIVWVVFYVAIPAWMLFRGWIIRGGFVQLIGVVLPAIWHGVFWSGEAGNFGLLMIMLVPIPLCIIVIGIVDWLRRLGGWAVRNHKKSGSQAKVPLATPTASADTRS